MKAVVGLCNQAVKDWQTAAERMSGDDLFTPPPDRRLHAMLRRRGMGLRSRAAELADALQRFRDRQAEIDAGKLGSGIQVPAIHTGWLTSKAGKSTRT